MNQQGDPVSAEAEPKTQVDESSAAKARKRRRALPTVLIVLATVVGIISVFALWAQRQLMEQDTWSNTSQQLVENGEIQSALSDFIVTSIYDNVDVEQSLADRLPPDLAPIAGPVASALRGPTEKIADKALQQPKIQGLFVDASDATHQKFVQLIEDKGEFVSTSGGVVTLDLKSLLTSVTSQLGVGSKAADRLPASAASIEIMKSTELSQVQTGVKALKTAAWFLTALTLVLFAAAILLGRGRRREILRSVGVSLVFIGLVVLFARNFASNQIVNSLSGSAANEAAVNSAFDIITSLLRDTGQSILVYGIVVILAAWFAGPARWAVSARRAVTPWLRQPQYAFGALALILIVLFWWGPLVATQRLIPSLVLIALSAAGVEVLRRQVIQEFPDLKTPDVPAGPEATP
ncbi:MAG TPA: hypothetical protein PKJ01_10110 [Solirubrobacterales bacterium]|nr:hypothetical protein [Solirubrobacterales bacterium]